jgi:hypothetical protein
MILERGKWRSWHAAHCGRLEPPRQT